MPKKYSLPEGTDIEALIDDPRLTDEKIALLSSKWQDRIKLAKRKKSDPNAEEYDRWRMMGFPDDPEVAPTFVTPKQWYEKDISEHFGEAVDRFAEENNPVTIAKGVWEGIKDPLLVPKSVLEMQWSEFKKAKKASEDGRSGEMVGHGLAAAVPLVGPLAADVVGRVSQGEFGSAAGTAASILAPGAVTRLGRRIGGISKSTKPPSISDKIDLTLAQSLEAKGSPLASAIGRAESLLRKVIPAEGTFGRKEHQQYLQAREAIEDIVAKVSGRPGEQIGAYPLGKKAIDALDVAFQDKKDQATRQYNDIAARTKEQSVNKLSQEQGPSLSRPQLNKRISKDQWEGVSSDIESYGLLGKETAPPQLVRTVTKPALEVSTRRFSDFAKDELRKNEGVFRVGGGGPDSSKVAALLKNIAEYPKTMAYDDVRKLRTGFMEATRDKSAAVMGGTWSGLNKRLSQMSSEVLEEAAKKSGDKNLLRDIKKANADWKYMANTYDDSLISKIRESSPENVFELFGKGSIDDLLSIQKELPVEIWNELRSKLLSEAFDRATSGETTSVLGLTDDVAAMSGIKQGNRADVKFNPASMDKWQENVIGKDRISKLFSDAEQTEINAIIKRSKQVFGPGSQSGNALAFLATSLNVGMLVGAFSNPAIALGTAGGTWVLSKMMTTKLGRSRLLDELGELSRRKNAPGVASTLSLPVAPDRFRGQEERPVPTMGDIIR
tara:strand:+ start:3159 stop:5321 length:2163 start_codon:yes stop_codon:yes gene_type:complete